MQAWILYAQRLSGNSELLVTPLRELVNPALNCFGDESLFQATAELFSDVLSNYSSFFTSAHYESLANLFDSSWAARHYERLLHGNHEEDGIAFGMLMLAYGDAKVEELMTSTDPRPQRFLSQLSGLLAADGYLVGEDHIFVPALEFWSTFVETMVDNVFSDDEGNTGKGWQTFAQQHLLAVVQNCWRKIQWPPVEVLNEWDSNERVGFGEARKDVADMLQSVFTLNGSELITFFADLFLQSLGVQSWPEVEASAFCLGSLSDCISDEGKHDGELAKVFSSPFFDILAQANGAAVPLRLRQTGLSLIERYCEYFERHSEYLPHALNLLFAAVGDPVLGGPSARSISTLCSSCRSILTGEAAVFITHYQTIRAGPQVLDSLAEERIVMAIASIIQAIPEESRRLEMFDELYGFLKRDFERSVGLKRQPELLNLSDPNFARGIVVDTPVGSHHSHYHSHHRQQGAVSVSGASASADEVSLQISLRSLRCLASMAKGMQDVKEHVVELDVGDSSQQQRRASADVGKLQNIQADILATMAEVQRTFASSGELVESICIILRAGFSETEPGPFVFPPDAVTSFFVSFGQETPRLGTLLSTACSFVGSLYRGPKQFVPAQLTRLLPWVLGLLQGLPGKPDCSDLSPLLSL